MTPTEAAFLLAIKHLPTAERNKAIQRYHCFLPDCTRQYKLNHKKVQQLTEKYKTLESKIEQHIQSMRNTRMQHHIDACRNAKEELKLYKDAT